MAILVVKVGRNEKDTYAKYSQITKHLDIVEIMPKEDKRTLGTGGDREFWGIWKL